MRIVEMQLNDLVTFPRVVRPWLGVSREFNNLGIRGERRSNYLPHSKPSGLTCKEPPVPKSKKPRKLLRKADRFIPRDELAEMLASLFPQMALCRRAVTASSAQKELMNARQRGSTCTFCVRCA